MARSFGHATSASNAVREREAKDEQAPMSRFFAAGSQCAQELDVVYGSLGLNLWVLVLAFAGVGLVARRTDSPRPSRRAPRQILQGVLLIDFADLCLDNRPHRCRRSEAVLRRSVPLYPTSPAFSGLPLASGQQLSARSRPHHLRQGYWTSQAPSMDKSRRASLGAALFWSLSK